MLATEAINHWRKVRNEEYEFLTESSEELRQRAIGLTSTRKTLELVLNDGPRTTFQPRISHLLFINAYNDAVKLKSSKHSPHTALAFIREFVMPMSGIAPQEDPVEGTLLDTTFVGCHQAEPYFNNCLIQLTTGRYKEQARLSVYHDADGTPLLFRKTHEVSSALSLKPIALEGTVVPAATLVAVDNDMPAAMTGLAYQDNGAVLETYLVDGPVSIAPNRSSPWVYDDPLDRSLYALKYRGPHEDDLRYVKGRGQIVEGRSLDDFIQASEQLMEMCGVSCS